MPYKTIEKGARERERERERERLWYTARREPSDTPVLQVYKINHTNHTNQSIAGWVERIESKNMSSFFFSTPPGSAFILYCKIVILSDLLQLLILTMATTYSSTDNCKNTTVRREILL